MEEVKAVSQEPKKTKRPRKPVGFRNRLDVINQDPNRVYRLINADSARVNQFMEGDYRIEDVKEHMHSAKPGSKGSSVDNVFHAGGGQAQVLVSIEKELYDEDQATKQAKIDAIEAQMKNRTDGLAGFYGKIEIQKT